MTIKSLRDTLLGLPSDYDNHEIVFCRNMKRDGERVISFEESVHGSLLPENREYFLILGKEAMNWIEDENPDMPKNGDWFHHTKPEE